MFCFPFFCYVHQDFRSYAMVQFGVSDLKLHSISRAQLVKNSQMPLRQTMNSNFYWNWSQLKVIHQLNSLERHLKALIALVGDTWAAQPVWFSKTNGVVGVVTRLVILLRKADSALMYCVHVLKLSLCCERIMVASFTVCKTDWHLLYLLFCRDIILLKPCASSTQRVVIFSRI